MLMPHPLRRAAALVGAGESDEIGFIEGKSSLQLHAEAVRNAVRDAGVRWEEIDGIFATGGSGRFPAAALAEYLGIRPRYMDSTQMGGSSFLFFVHHALAAIATGEIEVASAASPAPGAAAAAPAARTSSTPGTRASSTRGSTGRGVRPPSTRTR